MAWEPPFGSHTTRTRVPAAGVAPPPLWLLHSPYPAVLSQTLEACPAAVAEWRPGRPPTAAPQPRPRRDPTHQPFSTPAGQKWAPQHPPPPVWWESGWQVPVPFQPGPAWPHSFMGGYFQAGGLPPATRSSLPYASITSRGADTQRLAPPSKCTSFANEQMLVCGLERNVCHSRKVVCRFSTEILTYFHIRGSEAEY